MSEAQASPPPQGTPEKRSPAENHVKVPFLIPSPIITRRTRTTSMSRTASEGPTKCGTIVKFERNKGHGFIKPDGTEQEIFVHISDIEDEYVPQNGDRVTYKECPIPPKRDKVQAVEVMISQLSAESPHERWDLRK